MTEPLELPRTDELVLPFRAHGIDGRILIDAYSSQGPVDTGYDVAGTGYDADSFKKFPVITAHIDYDGTGFRQLFGWIQVVTHIFAEAGREPYTEIDHLHAVDGGPPFFPYGYLPMFFDAPANPGHPDMRWHAETFLAYPSGENEVVAVAGFSWGYDLVSGRPTRLPLGTAGPERWNPHLPILSKSAPTWIFHPDFGFA